MITRLLATAALTVAFASPAFAAGNTARDLTPSHGISCARGIQDMENELKVASVRGKQQQEALKGIEEARLACQAGDQAAAETRLAGVRQLLAGE